MAVIKRFNRYELKYVIPAKKQRAIAADLLNFMTPDENGDPDGYYRVTSLYYDSPDLAFYRSKIEGLKFRRKLRVRVYPGDDPTSVTPGFAEIKQRVNRTVQKKRLVLPLGEALDLCSGDYDLDKVASLNSQDAEAANEILYMQRSMGLRPRCVVSYRRRAFRGSRYEQGMRVTFDMLLQGRTNALVLNEPAKNHYFMPPDWFVMEVKVNERIPTWMTSLLAKHECSLQRVSKYCAVVSHGMKRFRIAYENKESLHG